MTREMDFCPVVPIAQVRFMKLKNFFSISVMMEKSPLGRCSLTVVTFIWLPWQRQPSSRAV